MYSSKVFPTSLLATENKSETMQSVKMFTLLIEGIYSTVLNIFGVTLQKLSKDI